MDDAARPSDPPSAKSSPRTARFKSARPPKLPPNGAAAASSAQRSGSLGAAPDHPEDRPLPLARSHTPGHLASKSITDRWQKSSDLAIRQRSQSASHTLTLTRPSTAGGIPSKPSLTSSISVASPRGEAPKDHARKPPTSARSTSTPSGRGTPSASAAARHAAAMAASTSTAIVTASSSSSSRHHGPAPPRGHHLAFPPLHEAPDAPDVETAPPSGMYWSRAFVSGAPHPDLRAHTTTLIGSNVYIFGGCDPRTCFNRLYVLDADSFYWSAPHVVGDIPMPLRAMTCTAVGKKLVVFGGGDGPTYYNDVYVLDTLNFRWSKPRISGDDAPSKRRAHTACLYKNGLYVFGGGDGARALNDIWRLDVSDPAKMSWKLISSPDKSSPQPGAPDRRPKARGYHTANMVGSKLIIFGGSDGGECFDDVWVYDVESQVWKAVSIPQTFRRLSHTATLVGSFLFVIGGHDGNEYCNDVLLLNLVTMTWDKRRVYGKPPSGRGYHGTVLHDSRLLVIGGFDGSEVFGDVMLLELAVHAYYSQISHFTVEV